MYLTEKRLHESVKMDPDVLENPRSLSLSTLFDDEEEDWDDDDDDDDDD